MKYPRITTIVWDFDGTIIPNDPYDSEQTLMLHRLQHSEEKLPLPKRLLARAAAYGDMREWGWLPFKKVYKWFLRGARKEILDQVACLLAAKIPDADRRLFLRLKEAGRNMLILSCGTADLIEGVLNAAGLSSCFNQIAGNRFVFANGRIKDFQTHLPNPGAKLDILARQGVSPAETAAVGDGYTDLPLLDWAAVPVLIDRSGKKRKYPDKDYFVISSLAELEAIIGNESGK